MNNLVPYAYETAPLVHQRVTFEQTQRQRFWAYLFEMGTGKTKLTIDVAGCMREQGWIDRLIVFAYSGTYVNWLPEIETHLPRRIRRAVAVWDANAGVRATREFQKVLDEKDPGIFKIMLMNVEALAFQRSFTIAYDFTRQGKTLAVMDESTCIKNPRAKRTLAAWKIRDAAIARRILTGSLVDNRPLDAWAQFEFLKRGVLGHASFFSFKSEYANLIRARVPDNRSEAFFKKHPKAKRSEDGRRGVQFIKGFRNLEKLKVTIRKYGTFVKKSECLDLPPKVYQRYEFDLLPDQRRVYDEMRKKAIVELENEALVTAPIVLTKMLRLHQIACGFMVDDDKNVHRVPGRRLDSLMEVLDESMDRGLIWSRYRFCITDILDELTRRYGADRVRAYFGDTTRDEREEVRRAARRGAETTMDWLVSNQNTGGYGNTWTAFNLVVYYANDFDGEKRNQSEDRAHRIGQTGAVTYVDLVARDTVDEKILKVIREKKNMSDLITTSNWKEWL